MAINEVSQSDTFDQWRQKTNLAIQETNKIGQLSQLDTESKDSVVAAINEINDKITTVESVALGSNANLTAFILAVS